MDSETLIKIFTGPATFGIAFIVLNFMFDNFEKGMDPKMKKEFGEKLLALKIAPAFSGFGVYVLKLVDIIFTSKHFSLKCFWKSLLASCTFILLLHFIFFFNNAEKLNSLSAGDWISFLISFIIFSVLYNSFDFFLLWKTRKLLNYLSLNQNKYFRYILLLDIFSSFLFGMLKYFMLMLILSHGATDFKYFFTQVVPVKIPVDFYPPKNDGVIPGLFFYGTFFYSVFLLLYFLSLYLIRHIQIIDKGKKKFQKYFDVENEPFAFLKFIFGCLLFIIILITCYIRFFKK